MKTTLTTTMKAAYVKGYGSPKLIEVRELSKPTPEKNEVLIKVIASSATRADTMMLSGTPLFARLFIGLRKPKHPIPGTGFAGIIESVGSDVSNFQIGDEVFGETTLGFSTNAEYVTVPESGVILHKPMNLPFDEASTFGDGHITSYNFLKLIGQIKSGQKVLINGASGSLGTAAVQLAKYFGAEVTAVCSTKNIELVKNLGANHIIDYKKIDFTSTSKKYDIIFDTVGKSSFRKCKSILTKNGIYLTPVLKFNLLLQSIYTSLFTSKKAKFAATGMKKEEEFRNILTDLIQIHQTGLLKTVIDQRFSLNETSKAHEYIIAGHKTGNVVITL